MSVLSKTSYWPLKYRLAQIFPFHLTGDKHTKKSKRFLKSNFFLLLQTVKYVIQPIKGKNFKTRKKKITWNDLSESISPFWKMWFSFNGCLCLTFMADIVRQDDWFDKIFSFWWLGVWSALDEHYNFLCRIRLHNFKYICI